MLLNMEEEYRKILPTCIEFEDAGTYENSIRPLLEKEANGDQLHNRELTKLNELDRSLRFFFLCTVLNRDLKVEETALARAYYYYISVLGQPGERQELRRYLQTYYRRLDEWMQVHEHCLRHYRDTGDWNPKLAHAPLISKWRERLRWKS